MSYGIGKFSTKFLTRKRSLFVCISTVVDETLRLLHFCDANPYYDECRRIDMALHKIKDFDPDYRTHFDDHDVVGYDLYSGDDKVGAVDDILVDDEGNFRYLVVNTGLWILGKKVLLPIGRSSIRYSDRRIYVNGLTKAQVEDLPEYDPHTTVDYDYEERVRGTYRMQPTNAGMNMAAPTAAVGTAAPISEPALEAVAPLDYDRDSYTYDRDRSLYDINEDDHQSLKLYQERLIASKTRQKTGEVTVGKRVETETQRVSVPIEKERVVIERVSSGAVGTPVAPGEALFNEGEVARVEVYEETPDIHKEAYVREEVRVKKEVDRDVVEAEEQLRREELDIDTQGNPVVQNPSNSPVDRR
jgi:uncharacterized protein (TIGR02271 family)